MLSSVHRRTAYFLAFALAALTAAPAPSATPVTNDVIVTPAIDRAIDGALKYLAANQNPDGSWNVGGGHRAAITAYVLHAFLATGNTPKQGPYGQQVDRGVRFLLSCVRPDGYIAAPTGEHNMYGHGISTIVLGEVYGMTQDETMRPKLESAIQLIIASQNKQGGWRYQPRPADADVSVTVLQAVALRVARNSGIAVPQTTLDRAAQYVRSCAARQAGGGVAYQAGGNEPGFARTAAAIYSLQVLGHYDDPLVAAGARYLQENKDQMEWFSYGQFYAMPAHYMIGGPAWPKWYERVSTQLLTKVENGPQGSFWHPLDQGGNGVGEVWATAVYTTMLAIPYQYLPIYQR